MSDEDAPIERMLANSRRRTLLTFGAAVVGLGLAPRPVIARQRPASVILGQVQLSFYAVTGGIVQEVLERLGHTVEVRQGPHEQMFPQLGAGEIDLMAAAWLPEGHAAYWARYGTDAVEVAPLYEDARFFLGVPSYVPAKQVASIADLAKPDVARRMTKSVQGIGSGATITVVAGKAFEAYGLAPLGYAIRPGTAADWTKAYDDAVAERRWIVFPTWAPQYLNQGGKIRALADPKGVLGGANRAVLVAPRSRWAALPETTRRVLSRIRLDIEAVTVMDALVNVRKLTPGQAAHVWMAANRERVDSWFAQS